MRAFEVLEADIHLATSGRIADELPDLDDRPLRGIMLTPRIAGIMLALIAKVREAEDKVALKGLGLSGPIPDVLPKLNRDDG
jgi:hypothetical protein